MYFLMVFNLLFSVFALNSHDNRCSAYSLQKGEPKTCEKSSFHQNKNTQKNLRSSRATKEMIYPTRKEQKKQ